MNFLIAGRVIIGALLSVIVIGCSSSDSPVNAPVDIFRIITIGDIPESQLVDIREVMTERAPVVMSNLGVSSMPLVTIKVWQDRNAFGKEFGEDATNVRGFIDSENWEVHVLNVRTPIGRGALHEFVHLVSLSKNQGNGPIPKWLWEAVAIYESKRPPPPNPGNLTCISSTDIPSLAELNQHPSNIYRVGNLLAEFIVETWSYEVLSELILNNGDVPTTLNISEQTFEQMWLSYSISQYDISPDNSAVSQQC